MFYLEFIEMLIIKSEEVFNFEWIFVNKYWEVIIVGSSSLILIIVICLWFKVRNCNNRLCLKFEGKI